MYSLGIVLWEIVSAIVTGKWSRPFAEYPQITMDFQVIIQVAKKNLRPTVPTGCPQELRELIEQLWSSDPHQRPSCATTIPKISQMIEFVSQNPSAWKAGEFLKPPTSSVSPNSSPRSKSLKSSREVLEMPAAEDGVERISSDTSLDIKPSRRGRERTRSVSDPPEVSNQPKSPSKSTSSHKRNK
jgi:hypothetical protein